MPALPDVPGVLKVVLHYQLGSDLTAINRLFFAYTGTPPTDAVCATIGGSVGSAVGSHLTALISSENAQTEVDVTDLTTPSSGNGTFVFSQAGTRAGDVLPANVCGLLVSKIGRRYRGGKPRTYWPIGTANDVLNSQEWSSSAVTAFQTGLDAFLTEVGAITESGTTLAGQVNVSYYEGFTPVLNPITGRTRDVSKLRTVPVVDAVLSNLFNPHYGSQRRRTLIRS